MRIDQIDNIIDNQIDNIILPKIESIKKIIISNYQNGLYGTRYNGYFGDDVNWFNTAIAHGDTNQSTQIDAFSSSDDFYSWQWTGYFKPSTTEEYTFYTYSDDASYLWIGETALSSYSSVNAIVNNGGLHGPNEEQGSINLVANQYYPIRIQFGEGEGGDVITVSFSTNTIPKTTDGEGYYFN